MGDDGSAVPKEVMDFFKEKYGIDMVIPRDKDTVKEL
jgi:hypothetical protein